MGLRLELGLGLGLALGLQQRQGKRQGKRDGSSSDLAYQHVCNWLNNVAGTRYECVYISAVSIALF